MVCGDLRGLHQSTICRCVNAVSQLFASNSRRFIKFPDNAAENQRLFYNISGFPSVTGCIDCTHVPIKSPGGDMAEVFRNRKRYFSINVQVVAGPKLEIMDIVARWPGREHDSTIFNNSAVKNKFDRNIMQGFLLGDSGYPCLRYLMTPLHNPQADEEQRYNQSHIRTRNTVERLFGLWKKRFQCLTRTLHNKVENVCTIIVACAILHNVSLMRPRDAMDEEEEEGEVRRRDRPIPVQQHAAHDLGNVNGFAVRRGIIVQHFRR